MKLKQLERFVRNEMSDEERRRTSHHIEVCVCCRIHAEELQSVEAIDSVRRGESATELPGGCDASKFGTQYSLATVQAAVPVVFQANLNAIPPDAVFKQQATPTESQAVPNFIGKYKVIRKLGEGGFGSVYHAQDTVIGKHVALKILKGRTGDGIAHHQLLVEARRICSVAHENVVKAIDVVHIDDRDLLVMELIHGDPLSVHLRHGQISVEQAVTWAQGIACGLTALHEKNVLHLDIKPSNVLVEATTRRVCIADIGLDREVRQSNGRQLTFAYGGTPTYMSPEQIQQKSVDQRSDIFSLGSLLYEMLTESLPFVGEEEDLVYSICYEQPRPLRDFRRSISRDLEAIVAKCLEKDPGSRYQTAQTVFDDLQRWKDAKPILAKPISLRRRSVLWARRNRWSVAIYTLLVSALMVVSERMISVSRANREAAVLHEKTLDLLGQNSATIARSKSPASESLRRELSLNSKPYYEFVLSNQRQTGASLAELANARFRLAWSLYDSGDTHSAKRHFEDAESEFSEVEKRTDLSARELKLLAEYLMQKEQFEVLVGLKNSGAIDASIYARALKHAERLQRITNSQIFALDTLGFAQFNLATALHMQKKATEALTQYELSIATLSSLENPTDLQCDTIANAYVAMANIEDKRGGADRNKYRRQAEDWWKRGVDSVFQSQPQRIDNLHSLGPANYRQALVIAKSMVELNPGTSKYLWALSDSLKLFGEHSAANQRTPANLNLAYDAAHLLTSQVEALARSDQSIAVLHRNGATMRYKYGEFQDANTRVQDFEALMKLVPAMKANSQNIIFLALHHAQAKNYVRSIAELKKLPYDKLNGQQLFDVACIHSLCLRAVQLDRNLTTTQRSQLPEEYSDAALKLLNHPLAVAEMKSIDRSVLESQFAIDGDLFWLAHFKKDDVTQLLEQIPRTPISNSKR